MEIHLAILKTGTDNLKPVFRRIVTDKLSAWQEKSGKEKSGHPEIDD